MLEVIIDENSSGQRLDRYIKKLLPNIPPGLVQKSIRKKNITVNQKKTKPNSILNKEDRIQIYFSDDTINKFKKEKQFRDIPEWALNLISKPVYEDENFIVLNKPVGLLSQPDSSGSLSVSDIIESTLKSKGTFSPAPLNRLDRNTSGIIIIPKNYQTQKRASDLIRNHDSSKKYLTLVKGEIKEGASLINSYSKNKSLNKAELKGEDEVRLSFKPVESNGTVTLLEVELETGKSHQIRVQLSGAGIPIIGDAKYGDKQLNEEFKSKYDLASQLLHAYNYVLFDNDQELLNVKAPLPQQFNQVLSGENINGLLEKRA